MVPIRQEKGRAAPDLVRTRKAILEAVRTQALDRLDHSIEEDKAPMSKYPVAMSNAFEVPAHSSRYRSPVHRRRCCRR